MIELTEQQVRALEDSGSALPRLVHPRTHETFVLIRVDEYERLREGGYDDSPWTREELEAQAWETGERSGWDDGDASDDCLKAALGLRGCEGIALCVSPSN